MRCLLTIAANSHSARLASQELQLQAEWASLVAVLYRSDEIHQQVVSLYESLSAALSRHDEAGSVQAATQLIDTFTFHLIENKIKYNEN
jgi:hypothetical protein